MAVVATRVCADIIASESLDSAVLVRWTGALADLMKADQAVVLAKGVQQAPVVTGFDVEQGHQQLVAAPRLFQPTTNQGPKVIASQIAGHEWIVHGRPEALAAGNQTVEQLRPGAIRTARRRAGDDGPRVPHAARKISDRDRAIIPANDEPLCHVLQLADIPRPFPPGEVAERIGREPRYRHAVLLAVLAKEVVEERRDIFGMVPQGWRAKVQYIEAVEQIKPERLDGDALHQIPVRGGDDTDVHARSAPFASDPLNLPGFEESQQQSLHPEAHLPDLIQKDCAEVRVRQQPDAIAKRAGETAPGVPEQLRFEQRFGDTRAVDRDERSRATLTARMNLACGHFLAGTGVAGDEDLCVAGRGDFDVGL